MELKDIILKDRPHEDVISDLKRKTIEVQDWEISEKEYNPNKHDIMDKTKRPDKIRAGKPDEEVARVRLGLEKLAVNRMAEFMFAIPVKRVYSNIETEEEQKVKEAIERIYSKLRINTENLVRSKAFFATCEICTMWHPVEKENNDYGFNSRFKLRKKTYSPMDGYSLYPLFDEYDDMLAMSIEYEKTEGEDTVTIFETYTEDTHIIFRTKGSETTRIDENIELKKIPFIYAHRKEPIWEGLGHIVKELEFTISRNSDIIAYNAAPVLKVAGELTGYEQKGESRRIYRTSEGGDVSYVSWQQSIEAIKYQIDTLLRMFFMQLQLPDISFENIKGLGAISGEARKTLLTDAHLKVGDEQGVFLEFLDRECSIIKAYLKMMNNSWAATIDKIDVEHIITPFIQNDEIAEIDKISKANGGEAFMSIQQSIEALGWSDDSSETLKQIIEERRQLNEVDRMTDVFDAAE